MSAFVSHDREDSQGVRAEVHVNTVKGKVKSIDDSNAKSAKAMFIVEWLKYPVGGWIGKDEPAYELLKNAKETGEEVDVRIESKRKKGVDRTLPIGELRGSAEAAQKNTTSVVVAVNGVATSEALTHPSEDPATGDAQPALPAEHGHRATSTVSASVKVDDVLSTLTSLATSREVSQGVVDAVAAQALIAGASPAQVVAAQTVNGSAPATQTGFSSEAPSYKEFNSDGRLNLGSYAVQGAVGAEGFVYENLRTVDANVVAGKAEFFTRLVLAIADRVQVAAYGEGFRPDRNSGSHTRIRGIIYDVVSHNFSIPAGANFGAEVNDWVQSVGKLARSRFLFSIRVSNDTATVAELLATLNGSTAAAAATPVAVAPVVETVIVEEPTPEPVSTQEEYIPTDEDAPSEEYDSGSVVVEQAPVYADEPVMFPAQLLAPGSINSSNTPDEETIEEFKQFVTEFMEVGPADLKKVSALLAQTFGKSYNNAKNIPQELLGDFMDFYTAAGAENFQKVISTL